MSLGFTKGAEQGSQMRSAPGKQLLRLQRFCAAAWLRVGAGSTFGARDFEGQPLGEGPGRSRGWAWESARESSPKLMHLFFAGLYVRVSDCILCFFKMFKEGLKNAEVLILFPDNVF